MDKKTLTIVAVLLAVIIGGFWVFRGPNAGDIVDPGGNGDGGKTDGGKTDGGKADDGKADDGKADDGKADDGKADDGKTTGDGKPKESTKEITFTEADHKDHDSIPANPPTAEQLEEYYPVGATSRSVSFLNIKGQGQRKINVITANRYFAYRYKVVAERKVLENDGTLLIVEVKFPLVDELRADSREEIKLELPTSPILDVVWEQAENILKTLPWYYLVRKGLEIYEKFDPRFKDTIAAVREGLERTGLISPPKQLDLAMRIKSLAGKTLKIDYIRDMGVQSIKVVKGGAMYKDELQDLAYNSSLLMDYYIQPGSTPPKVGDVWTVNGRQVSGIVNMTQDVSIDGNLRVKRGPDDSSRGETLFRLDLIGGRLEATLPFKGQRGQQKSTITPKDGSYLLFSNKQHIIREGRMKWDMTKVAIDDSRFLFGLKEQTDLTLESYYESRRTDPGGN